MMLNYTYNVMFWVVISNKMTQKLATFLNLGGNF